MRSMEVPSQRGPWNKPAVARSGALGEVNGDSAVNVSVRENFNLNLQEERQILARQQIALADLAIFTNPDESSPRVAGIDNVASALDEAWQSAVGHFENEAAGRATEIELTEAHGRDADDDRQPPLCEISRLPVKRPLDL